MEGLIEGRIVHYVLSADDAAKINRRRTSEGSIYDRIQADKVRAIEGNPLVPAAWPLGAQAHIGNSAYEGEHCPAIIVKVHSPSGMVNLKVFLDGSDEYWATSIPYAETLGTDPVRTWHWIEKA